MSWRQFCVDYKIPFEEHKNNIQINCPMCGFADHGYHMALHDHSTAYKCWKNTRHKGITPEILITAVLKCTIKIAEDLAEQYFGDKRKQIVKRKDPSAPEIVDKPVEFVPFTGAREEKIFVDYIKQRGFDPVYLTQRFNFHYATVGDFAWRLICPITSETFWYSWTGRSVTDDPVRYKTAEVNRPNDWLFDLDNLVGGDILFVKEGFFDACAIAALMIPNVHATALFGKQISVRQIKHILKLAKRYGSIIIALDSDAVEDTLKITTALSASSFHTSNIDFYHSAQSKDWANLYRHDKDSLKQLVLSVYETTKRKNR